MKAILEPIIALAAVIGIVLGGLAYFAKAEDLKLVEMRLDQKIVTDQVLDVQRQMWTIEDRNREHGSDCSKWPDDRDRKQYRELKTNYDTLQKKQQKLMK